jgi:hypothetical protein
VHLHDEMYQDLATLCCGAKEKSCPADALAHVAHRQSRRTRRPSERARSNADAVGEEEEGQEADTVAVRARAARVRRRKRPRLRRSFTPLPRSSKVSPDPRSYIPWAHVHECELQDWPPRSFWVWENNQALLVGHTTMISRTLEPHR